MANWLQSDGYEVICIVDDEAPVTFSDVFRAVQSFAERADVDKFVFYFAGHGYLNGNNETWLLTDAPTNAAEAIDGTASVELARATDIPHVIFVSDACRSLPANLMSERVKGGAIFPNRVQGICTPEVDFFFATRPGRLAYEVEFEKMQGRVGLFTTILETAHVNPPRPILTHRDGFIGVPNRWLRKVIPDRVEAEAQKRSVALIQRPELRLECDDSAFLASARFTKGGLKPAEAEMPEISGDVAEIARLQAGNVVPVERFLTKEPITSIEADSFAEELGQLRTLDRDPNEYQLSEGYASGSTSRYRRPDALLEILPSWGTNIFTNRAEARFFRSRSTPRGAVEVRFEPVARRATNVAITFGNGRGSLIPVLRGYSCRVVVNDGVLSGISYTPLSGTRLWERYSGNRERVAELRSIAGAASTHGFLALGRASAEAFADEVRSLKAFDPTLGLIAGVTYAAAGLRERVGSVLDYARSDLEIDLFDLWLLAGANSSSFPRFPACPLTTAGWSYLDILDVEIHPALRNAGRLGGYWTTFVDVDMQKIVQMVQSGEIN